MKVHGLIGLEPATIIVALLFTQYEPQSPPKLEHAPDGYIGKRRGTGGTLAGLARLASLLVRVVSFLAEQTTHGRFLQNRALFTPKYSRIPFQKYP